MIKEQLNLNSQKVTATELDELLVVEQNARKFGFEWPDVEMILQQAVSECNEIRDAIAQQESQDRLQEEIGDLIHTAISLCVFAGFDTKATLAKTARKFAARMQALQAITHEQGLQTLHEQSTEFMLELWREAKIRCGK